jgi:hypothetical protein
MKCFHHRPPVFLSQAPVFIASYEQGNRPRRSIPFSEIIRKTVLDNNAKSCIHMRDGYVKLTTGKSIGRRDFLKRLKETNYERPMASLTWMCPFTPQELPCSERDSKGFCLYSAYANLRFRPDQDADGRIRFVAPPRIRRRTAFAVGRLESYRPVTLSEGSTKPIRVALHDFQEAEPVDFHQDELKGVSEILYVKKLDIFQFTIALAVGLPYVSIRSRPILILRDGEPRQERAPFVLARQLTTEGLVIRLTQDARDKVLQNYAQPGVTPETLLTKLYHTISHAFLKPLPMMSGLDAYEFLESFSASDNEVAVYDNSPGGIGGIRTVVEEGYGGFQLRPDYVAQLLNSMECPLDCSWSCKACLYIGNCIWINRQLKRQMLEEVFDERLRNRYYRV